MRLVPYLLCGVLAAGCAGRVTGALQVDGVPFQATECRSGARYGLAGVELGDASGKRLRAGIDVSGHTIFSSTLEPSAQGTAVITVLEPGQTHPSEGPIFCGSMTVHNQAGRVIYRNVGGTADLSCTTELHAIAGHVEFAYCH